MGSSDGLLVHWGLMRVLCWQRLASRQTFRVGAWTLELLVWCVRRECDVHNAALRALLGGIFACTQVARLVEGLLNGCAHSTEYDEDEAFNQARHLSAREDTTKKGAKGSIMNIALPPDAPDEEPKSARADSESFPARESMPAEDSHKSPVHEEPVGRATVLKRQAKINHAFFSKSYSVDAVKVGSSPLSKGGSGKRRGRKRKRPEAEVAIPEEEEDEKEAGAVEQEDGFDTAAPGKHTPESNAAHRQGGGVLLRAAEAHAA